MITSKEILDKLRAALKKFGEYSFDDRGPSEVMDVDAILAELAHMPAASAGRVLLEVSAEHVTGGRGLALATYLVSRLECQDANWLEEVMKVSGITEY